MHGVRGFGTPVRVRLVEISAVGKAYADRDRLTTEPKSDKRGPEAKLSRPACLPPVALSERWE